jgi:hypothetical protein
MTNGALQLTSPLYVFKIGRLCFTYGGNKTTTSYQVTADTDLLALPQNAVAFTAEPYLGPLFIPNSVFPNGQGYECIQSDGPTIRSKGGGWTIPAGSMFNPAVWLAINALPLANTCKNNG